MFRGPFFPDTVYTQENKKEKLNIQENRNAKSTTTI